MKQTGKEAIVQKNKPGDLNSNLAKKESGPELEQE